MGAGQSRSNASTFPAWKIYQAIADNKNPTKLQNLLKTYNVNVISGNFTPLHIAIYNNRQDVAKRLIELGANVNANSSGLEWHIS